MSREEFIKTAILLGYCDKTTALDYTLSNVKLDYGQDDYIQVYRKAEKKAARRADTRPANIVYNQRRKNILTINSGVWRW